MTRIEYVANSTSIFVAMAGSTVTLDTLKAFAESAEAQAHEKSRQMTAHIGGDEIWLTSHAAHMRTLSAKIVALRGGYVPALQIDKNNRVLWMQAVQAMAYIRAEFEAMDGLMR